MTHLENELEAFVGSGGEHISGLDRAIAGYVPSQIESAEALLQNPDHQLVSSVQIGNDTLEVSTGNVDSVEPAEEAGKFTLHLKEEIAGHKGRTALITGASVLLLGVSIRVAYKKKHKT